MNGDDAMQTNEKPIFDLKKKVRRAENAEITLKIPFQNANMATNL